jgi:hypothetical protein
MNAQPLFKQGETSANVLALLECIQLADPSSPDINEDNLGLSWGHYQFTAGNLSPLSTLTSWQEIGSVTIAFKFVAAALKMCRDTRTMCTKASLPTTGGFISDNFLEVVLECLEKCWVGAGGVRVYILPQSVVINTFLSRQFLLVIRSSLPPLLPIVRLQSHLHVQLVPRSKSSRHRSSQRMSTQPVPQRLLPASSLPLTRNPRRSPQRHYMRCIVLHCGIPDHSQCL